MQETLSGAPETSNENSSTTDDIRKELIALAEDGDIDKSVACIKKASAKVINKLHHDVLRTRTAKVHAPVTDKIISNFADLLGGLDAIESPEELCK
jgi:hypothetical protein